MLSKNSLVLTLQHIKSLSLKNIKEIISLNVIIFFELLAVFQMKNYNEI